jgi:hypothetical protein
LLFGNGGDEDPIWNVRAPKRLRLDVAQQVDDPKETPVIVANRSAFEAALVAATATN